MFQKIFIQTKPQFFHGLSQVSQWSRVHIDYAGPIDNKYILVAVDAYSKFIDVQVTSSMTSNVTIELLRKVFCNFGIPDVVVSDNVPYFVSEEMSHFF